MKILFLRHPLGVTGGTEVYIKRIIKFLFKKGHINGFWAVNNCVYDDYLKKYCNYPYFIGTNKINIDWDLVVVQHNLTFVSGGALIEQIKNIPHIYISHSSMSFDQVVPYRQLYKLITVADCLKSSYHKWGIPDEMIEVVYNPVKIPKQNITLKNDKKIKMLLVVRLESDKIEMVRQIIACVNRMPNFELKIIGNGYLSKMIKQCANSNIIFEGDQKFVEPYYINSDIVIGSGRTAIEALSFCRPFIIAGIRGFGGLVTPENYHDLKKRIFAGKDGGAINEPISSDILKKEILNTFNLKNLEDIIYRNYQLVKNDFAEDLILEKLERIFIDTIVMHKKINDSRIRELYISKVSNCIIKSNKSMLKIIRLPYYKEVGEYKIEYNELFESMNGKLTVSNLFNLIGNKHFTKMNDFLYFLRVLFEKKIIIFNQNHKSIKNDE